MELSENKGIPPKFPNYNFKRENDKLQYQWILETATLFFNQNHILKQFRLGKYPTFWIGRIISISSCHEALTGARDPSARDCQ